MIFKISKVNYPRQSMKTKRICKSQWQEKALFKQTALDKAANNIKKASIIYNSIKIGRQS